MSSPSSAPTRAAARTAAFMLGASPPDVRTATRSPFPSAMGASYFSSGTGFHVSTGRVLEADTGDPRVDARVEMLEPRLGEDDLGVDQRRAGAASVVEQLARHPITLERAVELTRRRLHRGVGFDRRLIRLDDFELDAVANRELLGLE